MRSIRSVLFAVMLASVTITSVGCEKEEEEDAKVVEPDRSIPVKVWVVLAEGESLPAPVPIPGDTPVCDFDNSTPCTNLGGFDQACRIVDDNGDFLAYGTCLNRHDNGRSNAGCRFSRAEIEAQMDLLQENQSLMGGATFCQKDPGDPSVCRPWDGGANPLQLELVVFDSLDFRDRVDEGRLSRTWFAGYEERPPQIQRGVDQIHHVGCRPERRSALIGLDVQISLATPRDLGANGSPGRRRRKVAHAVMGIAHGLEDLPVLFRHQFSRWEGLCMLACGGSWSGSSQITLRASKMASGSFRLKRRSRLRSGRSGRP